MSGRERSGAAGGDQLAAAKERLTALVARERDALPGAGLGYVAELRHRGLAALESRGLPTSRDDDWKYTSVAPLAAVPFVPAAPRAGVAEPRSALVGELGLGPRLVFSNGRLDAGASRVSGLPRGVRVLGLRAALAEMPGVLEPVLGRIASAEAHGLAGLNAAMFGDGAVLVLEPGAVLEAPLHLLFVGSPSGAEAAFVRNVVVAGEGASASVVEHYLSDGESWLTSAVTEIAVGPGAHVEHHRLEEEGVAAFHVGSVEALVERDGRLGSHVVATGGRLARNEVRVALAAEGAECTLGGLYLPRGEQHLDCFTSIEHRVPRGTSRELYKGVLAGASRGVWTGRILVAEQAQKTTAVQTNRNLLLSEGAHVDTRPQLEIYADDVKCSHGAAVGRLDADAMFYLRARGIDEAAARALLTYAFVSEVLTGVTVAPLRQALERSLAAGLLGSGEVVA